MLDDAAAADRRDGARRPASTSSARGAQVRAAIGAALQEAALDPLLTGREHLRLQTALHGMPRAERARRGEELLERVGLTEAADRKVQDVLGRDEAPARPRARARPPAAHPLPRRADDRASTRRAAPRSGRRSARLARDDGVTVFLTTQYLEEADVLADRVGIIDHGRIVAEGTPARAQGGDRPAERRGDPGRPGRAAARRAHARALRRAASRARRGRRGPPRRRGGGPRRRRPRARRRGARRREPPAARADARRRLPRQDRPLARGRGRRRGRGARARRRRDAGPLVAQVAAPRAALGRCARCASPLNVVPSFIFPLILLAVNVGGLEVGDAAPGLPDRLVPRLRARRSRSCRARSSRR